MLCEGWHSTNRLLHKCRPCASPWTEPVKTGPVCACACVSWHVGGMVIVIIETCDRADWSQHTFADRYSYRWDHDKNISCPNVCVYISFSLSPSLCVCVKCVILLAHSEVFWPMLKCLQGSFMRVFAKAQICFLGFWNGLMLILYYWRILWEIRNGLSTLANALSQHFYNFLHDMFK